jgi:hypothetical protein
LDLQVSQYDLSFELKKIAAVGLLVDPFLKFCPTNKDLLGISFMNVVKIKVKTAQIRALIASCLQQHHDYSGKVKHLKGIAHISSVSQSELFLGVRVSRVKIVQNERNDYIWVQFHSNKGWLQNCPSVSSSNRPSLILNYHHG